MGDRAADAEPRCAHLPGHGYPDGELRRAVILKNREHIIILEAPAEVYAPGLKY